MTPEELAAAYPVGSRYRSRLLDLCTVTGHEDGQIIVVWESDGISGPWEPEDLDAWTRIDAPEPVAEPAPAPDDGLRERAALAALTAILAADKLNNADSAARAWAIADAFIAAKGAVR